MKIYFLGTNGWYDTKTGNTTCILIDSDEGYVILDAGNGIHKIDQFIKGKKPIYLFISHFHFDHIIGLHILNKFHFRQGLRIYGQMGTKRILNRLINHPFTAAFNQLPFKASIHELAEGEHRIPFYLKCKFLKHISRCLGYRFKLENKIIAYCTDTVFCNNALQLARDADLLIAECSYKVNEQDTAWPHLNPLSAGEIAKKAKVKKLALVHFDASIYKTLQERKLAQKRCKHIFRNVVSAVDNMQIKI